MPQITMTYEDNDPTPERIAVLAQRRKISPNQLVRRAVAEYLGRHRPPTEFASDVDPPTNLSDFLRVHGLLKP